MTNARDDRDGEERDDSSRSLDFFHENGLLLFSQKVCQVAKRRLRDRMLARLLRTEGLRLGSQPKLRGVRHMRVGPGFSAGDGLWLEAVVDYRGVRYQPQITIGRRVNVSDYVHIACVNRVSIGDGVLCGSKVLITDHDHGSYSGVSPSTPEEPPGSRRLFSAGPVIIGDNVFIGDGVIILAGAEIGPGAVIGANAVVKGSIPASCIAAGSPARVLRRWDPSTKKWRKE